VRFELTGPAFGRRVAGHDTDPVLWMALVVFAMTLTDSHGVIAEVTDPDINDTPTG
jgi:hypothetical protein